MVQSRSSATIRACFSQQAFDATRLRSGPTGRAAVRAYTSYFPYILGESPYRGSHPHVLICTHIHAYVCTCRTRPVPSRPAGVGRRANGYTPGRKQLETSYESTLTYRKTFICTPPRPEGSSVPRALAGCWVYGVEYGDSHPCALLLPPAEACGFPQ